MSAGESALQRELHQLYSDHHGWLYRWLCRKIGCAHNAADVAQDTFLRIVASRDALLGLREPRAYLTTTAKRLMVDRARRQRIEQAYLAELALLADGGEGYPSPEQTLATLEALAQIGAALDGLPETARQAFLLHFLDGESQAATADRLGVSTKTVQRHLAQALLHCQQAWD